MTDFSNNSNPTFPQDTISVLRLQNSRLKTLRSNQPASMKAQEMKRRQMTRTISLSGISSSDESVSDGEGPDDSWLQENQDIVHEMANVGLKTPRSVKKALRRRTVRRENHKCTCKGTCSTKICGCISIGKVCDVKCTCKLGRCKNRDPDSDLEISIEVSKNLFQEQDSDDFKENSPENDNSRDDFEQSPLKRPTKSVRRISKHPKIK